MRPTSEAVEEKHRLHAQGLRRCFSCSETLPVLAFGRYAKGHAGLQSSCRACINESNRKYFHGSSPEAKKQMLARTQEWRERNPLTPEQVRRNNLKRYGITPEDYDRMLSEQGGRCAICESTDGATRSGVFHIDHDHETGEVRGLLCGRCNPAIGALRNIDNLNRAVEYLSRIMGR